MPVIVELLLQPTDQDRKDLDLLQREHPALSRVMQDWQTEQTLPEAGECWVARFNDRILGAAWTVDNRLAAVAVRKETQGRGVATRLLTELAAARSLLSGSELAGLQWPLLHKLFDSQVGCSPQVSSNEA